MRVQGQELATLPFVVLDQVTLSTLQTSTSSTTRIGDDDVLEGALRLVGSAGHHLGTG
jgi:hypothetical protein